MVTIIENERDAGGAERVRFKPYRSPKTGQIFADWQHGMQPIYPKGPAAVPGSVLGTAVEIEFCHAVREAHENAIPFVWVDDPEGLFPPSDRPTFEIVPVGASATQFRENALLGGTIPRPRVRLDE
jgi:hypothetical protein